MKRIIYLMYAVLVFCYSQQSIAQCNAPASASVNTTVSTCINNGSISVHNISGGSTGSLLEFAITTSSNPSQPLVAYQNDSNFYNIYPGTYTISIRYNCGGSSYSPVYTATAVIAGNYQTMSAGFSNIQTAYCNNGAFTVNAMNGYTGISGHYTYQLVSAQGAIQPDPGAITPVQSSNVFDSLPAGTYYTRIFDDCGNFITTNVTVPAGTSTNPFMGPICIGNRFFKRFYGCDSFKYFFNGVYVNGTNNISYPIKFITVFPDSTRDTVNYASQSAFASYPQYNITNYINNNQTGPFYQQIVDGCGNIYNSYKLNFDTTLSFYLGLTEQFLCDSVTLGTNGFYSCFSNICPVSLGNNTYSLRPDVFGTPMPGYEYSIDSGTTWLAQQATTVIPYNTTINFQIRICGSVYNSCTSLNQPSSPFTATAYEDNSRACNGNSGIYFPWPIANLTAGQTRISFLQIPPAQTTLPDITINGRLFSNQNDPVNYLNNLALGKYVYTVTDTFCGRSFTDSITLTEPHYFSTAMAVQQGCSQGNIAVNIFNDSYGAYYNEPHYGTYFGNAYIISLVNSSGTTVGTQTYYDMPDTASVIFANLPVDTYTAYVLHDTTFSLDGRNDIICPVTDTIALTTPSIMDLSASQFITCSGTSGSIAVAVNGGLGPYTYELYNGTVAPANLVTTQTSALFTGLNANQTYSVRVIDNCGTGVSVSKSFAPYTGAMGLTGNACPGNALTLYTDTLAGASYSWTKDGNPLPDTTNSYYIDTLVVADYGTYAVTVSVPGCADYTINRTISAATCTALPLELLSFDARKDDSRVLLDWTTTAEQNINYFEIEHSANGSSWAAIGKVNPAVNTAPVNHYSFTHNSPAAGKNYYKLKIADKDGSYQYSQVRIVSWGSQGSIILYPNPVTDVLNISTMATSPVEISLYAADGRMVKQYNDLPAKNSIDIKKLPRGVYYIRITCDNMTTVQQISKW